MVTDAGRPAWTASEKPAGMTTTADAFPSATFAVAVASSGNVTIVAPLFVSAASGPSTSARASVPPSPSTTPIVAAKTSLPDGRRVEKTKASPSGATTAMRIADRSRTFWRRSFSAMANACDICGLSPAAPCR